MKAERIESQALTPTSTDAADSIAAPASALAIPSETARAEVNAASLMTAMMMPSSDGIFTIGSVTAKVTGVLKAVSRIGNSWGFWSFALVLGSGLISGCEPTEVVPVGNTNVIVDSPADVDDNKAVCDPFSNNTHPAASYDHGIVGHLKYLSDDQPRYTRAVDYKENGHPVDTTLFMGAIDVPTRAFDLGFTTLSGETIKNDKGNTLYEYFSVHMESVIRLNSANAVGKYQFAILSDDGAVMQIDTGTGYRTLIDNDGTHSTKMGCATTPVSLDFMSKLPIKVDYYQGPRYHISMVLLWREWKDDGTFNPADPECGRSGNSRYWDSTKIPSAPTSVYNNMLARGWKPVAPENFHLPESVNQNPCQNVEPVTTTITNVDPSAILTNSTQVSFYFASNYADATFLCSMDGVQATPCASPMSYTGLSSEPHVFKVHAVDSSGNIDVTGASYSWTIDATIPAVIAVNSSVTNTTITVNWTTSEETTTMLYWGPGSTTNNIVPDDGIFTVNHAVTLTGLIPDTVYSYRLSGQDRAGNVLNSSRRIARTEP